MRVTPSFHERSPLAFAFACSLSLGGSLACSGSTSEYPSHHTLDAQVAGDARSQSAVNDSSRERDVSWDPGDPTDATQDAGGTRCLPERNPEATCSSLGNDGGSNVDSRADVAAPTLCYPPVETLSLATPHATPRPAYLVPVTDDAFGTEVVRITDANAFAKVSAKRTYHHYAKDQPWNADGTRILMDGWPAALLDGQTYQVIESVAPPGEHHTWSNVDPHLVYGVSQPVSFVSIDVETKRTRTLHTFNEYDQVSFGEFEGNLPLDDRFVALQAKKGARTVVFAYDLQADSKGPEYDGAGIWPNNVSMTQSGAYVTVQWDVDGSGERQGITLHERGTMRFLRNLAPTGGGHADACYDASGNEVLVVQNDSSPALIMVRLSDGVRTELLGKEKMGWNIHISCRNVNRPGYTYISQFESGAEAEKPYWQTVFAVKLDGSGKVERYADEHHSAVVDYDRSPFAVPSRDGARVMWRSDWGDGAGPIDSYVAKGRCP